MLVERSGSFRYILIVVVIFIFAAPLWTRPRLDAVFSSFPAHPSLHAPARRPQPVSEPVAPPKAVQPVVDAVDHNANYVPSDDYRILYSLSTRDKKYFGIDFGGANTYNPNIVPHPVSNDSWIVVAQDSGYRDDINTSEQDVCVARFKNGVLHCDEAATALPITPSILGRCEDKLAYVNMRRGPRDGRVFYGPDFPYMIYGSQSYTTCLGLWIQNLWMLLDGFKHPPDTFARGATEIRRPKPLQPIEKNYFLFWDDSGKVYAHYDIWPRRTFAELQFDGSPVGTLAEPGGADLGALVADESKSCMAAFPAVDEGRDQSIHQGTNSLSITMCARSDPACNPTDDNTFILHIMQHKTFEKSHAIYEPYPVLFRRSAPFALHAVAKKPLYYHGRGLLTEKTDSRNVRTFNIAVPNGHTEMVYTTSISWKQHGQRYHGYMDDPLFLAFGIEDTRSGAIDVLAQDILQDLNYCS